MLKFRFNSENKVLKVRRHKFKAKPINDNGKHFDSTLEYKYSKHLELRQRAGEILFFLRQVRFDLPGNVKFYLDFVLFKADETVEFHEVKGVMTPLSQLKINQVEDIYPIKIKIIRKGDF